MAQQGVAVCADQGRRAGSSRHSGKYAEFIVPIKREGGLFIKSASMAVITLAAV
jgi:hypothetical protein